MNDVLRFGLIGCGRVAPRHAQSLAEIKDAKLVAVADVFEGRSRKFGVEYGTDSYTDYRCVLDRQDVDVVDICVPSGLHAQIAIESNESDFAFSAIT